MFRTIRINGMFIALCLIIPAICSAQDKSPSDIVALFNQCYGTARMDEVADYTTSRFRDEKPKSVWISDTWKVLRLIAYKRGQSTILGSKIAQDKTKAAIVIATKIETTAGETNQREIFYFINTEKQWLIDGLEIVDEKVEGCLENMNM